MIAQISEGHIDLADLLFLIAAVVFAVHVVYTWTHTPAPTKDKAAAVLIALGLCLVSVAAFVL